MSLLGIVTNYSRCIYW